MERYHLGNYAEQVANEAARLDAHDILARLWSHDHTLWSESPEEIIDRLGWLTLPADMEQHLVDLAEFAIEARDQGCRHVVLLGMGGSSLGPEVIHQVIGGKPAYPEIITLDSTVPEWVTATAEAVDLAETIFVVSSKSGTTTEPNAFYAYFRDLVTEKVGAANAGMHFVAVTDRDTALAKLARAHGFRRLFLNNPNIGGRYSVLSHFGLVPAALAGVDLERLLERAGGMQRSCLDTSTSGNPGAWLGVVIGALAKAGRDKLTLFATPGIDGFGLWVEQLLAESMGKAGTGVIPVAGEPILGPECYGDDRLFVQLCLANDDGSADEKVAHLEAAGHPVVRLGLSDVYDLGGEFYRWEFATAIAGHILGIHPFDQPDVQGAKDRTIAVLRQYERDGELPAAESADSGRLGRLLSASQPGDYLAIMAYLPDSIEVRSALDELRLKVIRKYGIATTVGYGPRFLHSTGQLHKGGPDSGIFLQLTQRHSPDVAIPGWAFSFGILADAQSLGDLRALQDLGRRTASLHLDDDPAESIRRLTESL